MKLSTKARYGMRAIIDIALQDSNTPIMSRSICSRQEISPAYLEQILTLLKTAGLVRSSAGPGGGFNLTRKPSDITTLEIMQALEGPNILTDCIKNSSICPKTASCLSRHLWCALKKAMDQVLKSTSLQDLIDGKLENS
jgi:Rrf2 family transcriptional regulator, cysteine metabolism repressor